jgi:hypothetical protein
MEDIIKKEEIRNIDALTSTLLEVQKQILNQTINQFVTKKEFYEIIEKLTELIYNHLENHENT